MSKEMYKKLSSLCECITVCVSICIFASVTLFFVVWEFSEMLMWYFIRAIFVTLFFAVLSRIFHNIYLDKSISENM